MIAVIAELRCELLGNLGSNILSVMKIIGFENSAVVNDTWIRAYSTPFPDRESCLGAIEAPLDTYLQRIVPYILEERDNISKLATRMGTS